jgi:hypothetical protein
VEQATAARRSTNEDEILRCVQFALRKVPSGTSCQERRRERRHPFPYPVRLVPVDGDGEAIGAPIVVVGKHLSSHGLDFYYREAISHRRVIAAFDVGSERHVEMLMDLAWCRFGGHGWYENGGRFLSAVHSPGT